MRKFWFLVVGMICSVPLMAERHISSAADLRQLAQDSQTQDFAGEKIILEADIDLGGKASPWQPIGCSAFPFKGELDGQNHVIRNLYIFGASGAAGLIAETGIDARVHNLALAQGLIMTNGTNDIGGIIGIHRGVLDHCFSMVQISAKDGDRIGGLVGTNEGEIRYAYNTGIVTAANDKVGGLVGLNKSTAVLQQCYNAGYCLGSNHIGSLFGENEAGSTLDSVFFDQQVTRMHASGYGGADATIDNNNHAIGKTTDMLTIFEDNTEWDASFAASYPQLKCLSSTNASRVSAYGILLDTKNQPTERAEGVGAPTHEEKPRESFGLCQVAGTSVTWVSPNEDVIEIQSESTAAVYRPCGNQQLILTVTLGDDTKEIYTQVKGYDTFDAGKLDGHLSACWQEEGVTIAGNGKEPTGGKDDEQTGEKCYQYMIVRFGVSKDAAQNEIRTPLDTVYLSDPDYQQWAVPTDSAGEFVFIRKVHDYQCQTTFTESEGELRVVVRELFDPGKLYDKPDTIYGVPSDTIVFSERDASGGSETFRYLWNYVQLRVNYITGAVDTVAKGPVRVGYDEVTTATCPVHFTEAGEYLYTRVSRDAKCTNTFLESNTEHRIVVYAALKAGTIGTLYQELCSPTSDETIHELTAPSGGNGLYTYRWTCNGEVIAGADSTELSLSGITMEAGKTYVFRREVKDGTGFSDWTASDGTVTLVVYSSYDSGAIQSKQHLICSEPKDPQQVTLSVANDRVASGDGDFVYSWLLFSENSDTTMLLDTLPLDTIALEYDLVYTNYAITLPTTLKLRRTVQNSRCKTEWQDSKGEVVYVLGIHQYDTIDVPVCALDLPYTGTYTYADGRADTYTVAKDSDMVMRQDKTAEGCPRDVVLLCRAIYAPEVEVQPVVSMCQTDTMLILHYSVIAGTPDHYDITFSDSALAVGFLPIMGAELTDSAEVAIPVQTTQLGQYGMSIRFYTATVGESECKGPDLPVHFTLDIAGYVHRKWNDVVFVDNSDKNCEPNCDEDLTFVAWQWYCNDQLLEGATGQFYYEQGGLNGIYFVEMTAEDGTVYRSCRYEIRPTTSLNNVQESRLQVYPVPALCGSPVHVEAETEGRVLIYNTEGTCCGEYNSYDGVFTLTAPAVPGIYLVRWIGNRTQCATRKLIVL